MGSQQGFGHQGEASSKLADTRVIMGLHNFFVGPQFKNCRLFLLRVTDLMQFYFFSG